jgi:hypothetical protein
MSRVVVSAMLVIASIIHLIPLSGVLGADRLSGLYGVPMTDPNLAILMRHRAVLFGMLGSFLLLAAFRPRLQPAALGAGLVSVVTFLVIAWSEGPYNDKLARVFNVDLVALACLVIGLAFRVREGRPNGERLKD